MKNLLIGLIALGSISAFADRASFEKACYDEDGRTYEDSFSGNEVIRVGCQIPRSELKGDKYVELFSACSADFKKAKVIFTGGMMYNREATNITCNLK